MEKKICIILLLFVQVVYVTFAQDDEAKKAAEAAMATKVPSVDLTKDSVKYWKFTGMFGLNASETQFWNWVAGGNNNLTSVIYANITLSYKKKKLAWDSNLDTELGELYSSDLNPRWRKSNDKLNMMTKFGYKLAKSWYLSVLGGFKSQYAAGYEYANNDAGDKKKISDWASPSYTDLSIGMNFLPNDIFTVFVSPVAGRLTFCRDSLLRANYGVPVDHAAHAALGLSIKAGVNYTKIKHLKIISTLSMFSPYTSQEIQKFGNFDVDWDVAVSYQFFKVLNVSLMTSLKYYDQVLIADPKEPTHLHPNIQFKEVIGVGVGYSF